MHILETSRLLQEQNVNRTYRLCSDTKEYLSTFHNILNEMISRMTEACLTDSISHNFIVQMIPHHQAAIEMSRNILQYTSFVTLQDIAEQIITEQTKSIENMEHILDCCSKQTNSQKELQQYQCHINQIMQNMFAEMGNAYANHSIDADFMREMIPHHRGAVRMSKTTLQYSICNELVPILQAIIASQERGIVQMEQLLRCCYSHQRC